MFVMLCLTFFLVYLSETTFLGGSDTLRFLRGFGSDIFFFFWGGGSWGEKCHFNFFLVLEWGGWKRYFIFL